MRKIVITPRGFYNYGSEYKKLLEENGFSVDWNDTGEPYTVEQFYSHCKDAEGLIAGLEKVDKDFIDACPQLKAVVKFGIGTDNIDIEYCEQKGIFVGKCVNANSRSVAELVLAFILSESRDLYKNFRSTKDGGWNKPTGNEVLGKTLGIIGFGSVGRHLANIARGVGFNILAYDLYGIDEETALKYGITAADPETIYAQSDFLTLHVPLTPQTKDMITLDTMKKMKRSCVIINTSRGGIVSEEDLYTALSEKIIKAAYFDVFSEEPPKGGEPLLKLDNFYLTPHIGSRTAEAETNTCRIATDIILNSLA